MGEKWKKWKTTVFGVITAVLMVLVLTGVITPEQKEAIDEATGELSTQVDTLWVSVSAVIGIVSGIINVFRAD